MRLNGTEKQLLRNQVQMTSRLGAGESFVVSFGTCHLMSGKYVLD